MTNFGDGKNCMVILRLLLLFGISGFIGCAYFSDGATSRIKIRKQEGGRIFLNKVELGDTIQEVEIRNSNENLITIKNADSERSEVIRSEFNPSVFGNIAWPYAFVDLKLGSHRQIADGNSYKVVAAGPEIRNGCEGKARDNLKNNIRATWIWFTISAAFALAAGEYSLEKGNRYEISIPLSIAAWVGLAGTGYNVYKTGERVKEINLCIDKRIKNQFTSPK